MFVESIRILWHFPIGVTRVLYCVQRIRRAAPRRSARLMLTPLIGNCGLVLSVRGSGDGRSEDRACGGCYLSGGLALAWHRTHYRAYTSTSRQLPGPRHLNRAVPRNPVSTEIYLVLGTAGRRGRGSHAHRSPCPSAPAGTGSGGGDDRGTGRAAAGNSPGERAAMESVRMTAVVLGHDSKRSRAEPATARSRISRKVSCVDRSWGRS